MSPLNNLQELIRIRISKKHKAVDYSKNHDSDYDERKEKIKKLHHKVIPDGYFAYPVPEIKGCILVKLEDRGKAEIRAQEFLLKYKESLHNFETNTITNQMAIKDETLKTENPKKLR